MAFELSTITTKLKRPGMFYVIGISIAFFLSLIVLTKQEKTFADKLLGVWLSVIGSHLLLFYCNSVIQTFPFPHLLGLEIPMPFLHGPFLYLYTAALTRQIDSNTERWQFHFVPTGLIYLYLISFYRLPASQKIFVFSHQGQGHETFMSVLLVLLTGVGILYVFLTYRIFQRHKRTLLSQLSPSTALYLPWLRSLFYGISLIWAIILFRGNDQLIFTAVVCFVVFIGYFGIKRVGIFTDRSFETAGGGLLMTMAENQSGSAEPEDAPAEKRKYAKSGLSESAATQLHANLVALVQHEQLFKECDLTLSELAARLDIHPNYLSQVINEKEGVHFYDYLNRLRIEEFMKQAALPENKPYTLLGIAYACGFNSKSSFNRSFKKVTDRSPSEFMKQIGAGL